MVVDILIAVALIYATTVVLLTKGGINVNFTVTHKHISEVSAYEGKITQYTDEPNKDEEDFLAGAKSLVGSINEMLYGAADKKKE